MLFELTNALAMSIDLMDKVFRSFWEFVEVFIDDILIYSSRYKEHEKYLKSVLWVLRENWLHAIFDKCEFWLRKMVFLVHVMSAEEIMVDLRKVKVVLKWKRSVTIMKIQSFLGLEFHRRMLLLLPLSPIWLVKKWNLSGPNNMKRVLKS